MSASDQEIVSQLLSIYSGIDFSFDYLLSKRPLLAHYTSIDVIEKIIKNNEVWMSNPLFMNDLEEMRFGLSVANKLFMNSIDLLNACGSKERADIIRNAYWFYYNEFDQKHSLDVYVFCMSEHDPKDTDGRLSMWRGYGHNGNGAALVFNTDFVVRRDESPLIFSKVIYASGAEREAWINGKLDSVCKILSAIEIDDEKLHIVANAFFGVAKLASLIFKHRGFIEENEWRIIYMADRDKDGRFFNSFDYVVGARGVEPKLKLEIKPIAEDRKSAWTLGDILDRIILGPSTSTPLARNSIIRMLSKIGKAELCEKVHPSRLMPLTH